MLKNKIVWVTNIILPKPAKAFGIDAPYGGSWLVESSVSLSKNRNIELIIIFPHKLRIDIIIEGIRYISFSNSNMSKKIINEINPQLIHIFGTEMFHSYVISKHARRLNIPSIIHIQGIISEIYPLIDYQIPMRIKYLFTLRDLLKLDNILLKKIKYFVRGQFEKETIRNASILSGRTMWDKSITESIRSNTKDSYVYHENGEMLRNKFYTSRKWNYSNANRTQIFISQAHYPIKGLHIIIPEIAKIKNIFPDLKVFISGRKVNLNPSFIDKLKETMYERYLRNEIKKYHLSDTIKFTGPLNEDKMIKMYLESTITVLPSLIENSPNSLAEALYLGVPSISTFVGGIPSMTKNIPSYHYYDFKSPELFSEKVCELLLNVEELTRISNASIHVAEKNYSKDIINRETLKLYEKILEGNLC